MRWGLALLALAQPAPAADSATARACPERVYFVPDPDPLAEVWQSRRKYRLVIGAGEYARDPSADRSFVEPTARAVDAALERAGYTESLGLYVGKDATRAAIQSALETIAALDGSALIVIYYLGHGIPTASTDDVALAVYDEPVAQGYGVRVRDALATAVKPFDPAFRKFPRLIVVLETCYSGAASPFKGGIKSILESARLDWSRIALLSATTDTQQAWDLDGQGVAAFGDFLRRALEDEWSCADITPDGALTVLEMRTHLHGRLKDAFARRSIGGPMTPALIDPGHYATLTYHPERVADLGGYREAIKDLYAIQVDDRAGGAGVTVQTTDGAVLRNCIGSCRVLTDSPELVTVKATLPGFSLSEVRLGKGGVFRIRAPEGFGARGEDLVRIRVERDLGRTVARRPVPAPSGKSE